jgi:hypothetical protein
MLHNSSDGIQYIEDEVEEARQQSGGGFGRR